jgi:hypothetical protein
MRMVRKLRVVCLFVGHQDPSPFPANSRSLRHPRPRSGTCVRTGIRARPCDLRAIARPAVYGFQELSPLHGSMSLRLQSE